MEPNYTEANIFLVVYDTLDKEWTSIFIIVDTDEKYFTEMIEQVLQKMKVIKIHEMIFWYEGHVRTNPIFIDNKEQYEGVFALRVGHLEHHFFIEEVLIYDVVFSNEMGLVFRRKIIFPKNINLQLIEKEIREMYWKVKDVYTIALTV